MLTIKSINTSLGRMEDYVDFEDETKDEDRDQYISEVTDLRVNLDDPTSLSKFWDELDQRLV
jgi:alcohol dehydrogenase class IV